MNAYGSYKDNYPKNFIAKIIVGNVCFPQYRHSKNGVARKVRRQDLDKYWVVPYNSYLLAIFDCHINVNIYYTIKAIIYLCKYIYKGKLMKSSNFNQFDGLLHLRQCGKSMALLLTKCIHQSTVCICILKISILLHFVHTETCAIF